MGWRDFWPGLQRAAVDESRWIVVDVETTGLDVSSDRLLAIAAIALRVDWTAKRVAIHAGDSFEVVLHDEAGSFDRANIFLHGIGVQRQREGIPGRQALAAFTAYVGASPLLAFHSSFDQAMVDRCCDGHGARRLGNPWVDIEKLCAVTHEEAKARSLDEWMDHFGITCAWRHQAAADAMAECEVMLRIWPRIARQCRSWREVTSLAAGHRWIGRR